MRFIPMQLRTAQRATGGTNHSRALHFPPVTTPVGAVEIAPGVHPTPCGDGLNDSNLSNDLKIHDVSSSHSSALSIHGSYASVMHYMSMEVAELSIRQRRCHRASYRSLIPGPRLPFGAPKRRRKHPCLHVDRD